MSKLRVEAKSFGDFRVLLPDGSELGGVTSVRILTELRRGTGDGSVAAEIRVELDSFLAETWPEYNPESLKIAAKRMGYDLVPSGAAGKRWRASPPKRQGEPT